MLVHRDRGALHIRPREGNAEHPEKALDDAILAVRPVQRHEGRGRAVAPQPLHPGRRIQHPPAEGEIAAGGDLDRHRLEAGLAQRPDDGGAAGQRHFPLGPEASGKHGDFHALTSCVR